MKRTHFRLMSASVGFVALPSVSAPALLAAVAPPLDAESTGLPRSITLQSGGSK
jgi:hypothetical protein